MERIPISQTIFRQSYIVSLLIRFEIFIMKYGLCLFALMFTQSTIKWNNLVKDANVTGYWHLSEDLWFVFDLECCERWRVRGWNKQLWTLLNHWRCRYIEECYIKRSENYTRKYHYKIIYKEVETYFKKLFSIQSLGLTIIKIFSSSIKCRSYSWNTEITIDISQQY